MLRPTWSYMQIKDALLADASVVVAGAGDGEVRETVRALRADGFDGFFSLEPHLGQVHSVRRAVRTGAVHRGVGGLHRHPQVRRDSSTHEHRRESTPDPAGACRCAGVIGTIHAAVISELADRIELVAVVDLHLDRAEKLAAEHGGTAFTSLDAMRCRAVEIDVVSVCTPTGRHGEVAIEALEAGKHVIIEKPAEMTVAKTDEIIAAQRRRALVAVISQHRFDPATEVALTPSAGELGRLTSGIASIDWWRGQTLLRLRRLAWHLGARRRRRADEPGRAHRRPAGGHDGPPGRGVRLHRHPRPRADRGRRRRRRCGEVRERCPWCAACHHRCLPGSQCSTAGARRQGLGRHRQRRAQPSSTSRRATAAPKSSAYGQPGTAINQIADYPEASGAVAQTAGSDPGRLAVDSHRRQYENFLAALAGKEPLRVDLETNRQSIAVITGVYESARTGKPVALP